MIPSLLSLGCVLDLVFRCHIELQFVLVSLSTQLNQLGWHLFGNQMGNLTLFLKKNFSVYLVAQRHY